MSPLASAIIGPKAGAIAGDIQKFGGSDKKAG